ncbi:MAG: hypothetical protein ACK2UT_10200 [Candidatus Promineifilaceae bacterium]
MKSTTLAALALTLLMFLLVLLAAFVFVFQGQLALRDDLAGSQSEIETLRQDQAQLQLEQSSLQATATRLSAARATSDAESLSLTTQLAETDLTVTAQAAESAELLEDKESAQATRQFYEDTGPLVAIIEPRPSFNGIVGEEITLLIVASDAVGVRAINISINDELIDDVPLTPEKSVVVSQLWTPDAPGPAIITVTAVNEQGKTSQPAAITIQVQNPSPTATVTAAETTTAAAEVTVEATAENR